ncbi:hypothetical protein MD484_g5407, partial [Candolleomyces efflorescens]
MDRLSNELLGEIFLWCIKVPLSQSPTSILTPGPHEAPLVFLSVCKQWRKQAQGHPRLWTEVVIRVPLGPRTLIAPPPGSSSPTAYIAYQQAWAGWEHRVFQVARGINQWLKRSVGLPLNLYLDNRAREAVPRTPVEASRNFMALLGLYRTIIGQEHRWRSIVASLEYGSVLWEYLFCGAKDETRGTRCPLLEDVNLRVEMNTVFNTNNSIWPEYNSDSYTIVTSAPNLRSLKTGSMPLTIHNIISVFPPWRNLTSLGLLEASPREVLYILRGCPLLYDCNFVNTTPDQDIDDTIDIFKAMRRQPMVMYHLKHAFFQGFNPALMNQISARMKAPNLYHLGLANVTCAHLPWRQCNSQICDMIVECGESLRSLNLDHYCVSKEHLRTYLTKARNLEKLIMDYQERGNGGNYYCWYADGMFDAELLRAMTGPLVDTMQAEGYQVLLPNLVELACYAPVSDQGPVFDKDTMLRFLASRQPPYVSVNALAVLRIMIFQCKVFGKHTDSESRREAVNLGDVLRKRGIGSERFYARAAVLVVPQETNDSNGGDLWSMLPGFVYT